jgi:hypothetical protein
MDGSAAPLLSCLAFAAIITAFLLRFFQKQGGMLAGTLLGYFGICSALIVLRWYFQPDLAVYDTAKYQTLGAQIAALLRADFWGNLPYIIKAHAAYTLPLGLLYYLFGISEPLGQMLNTALGLGVILNLHRLAASWFNRRTADLTALFLALYPTGWILGSTLNRDMMVVFSITLLFRLLSVLSDSRGAAARVGLGTAVLGNLLWMALLRPPLLTLGALAVLVYWLVNPRQAASTQGWLYRTLRVSFILLLLVLGGIGFSWVGDRYLAETPLEYEVTKFAEVESMNQRLEISEGAGSTYARRGPYASYGEVAKAVPLAVVYFLFSPLPWQVTTSKQALGMVDSAWMMLVLWFFLKGVRPFCRRHRKICLALLAFLIVGISGSSVLQANAGSAIRHRLMFSLLMVPVAVQGMTVRREARTPAAVRCRIPG